MPKITSIFVPINVPINGVNFRDERRPLLTEFMGTKRDFTDVLYYVMTRHDKSWHSIMVRPRRIAHSWNNDLKQYLTRFRNKGSHKRSHKSAARNFLKRQKQRLFRCQNHPIHNTKSDRFSVGKNDL